MDGGVGQDLSLTSVAYNATLHTLTWVCVAGAELQGDQGGLYLSKDGGAYAQPTGTYTAWGDTGGVLTLLAALAAGTYAAYLINGDGQQSPALAGAFTVSGGVVAPPQAADGAGRLHRAVGRNRSYDCIQNIHLLVMQTVCMMTFHSPSSY